MKKILAAILTSVLLFSSVGNIVFQDQTTTVEAKSYKSGKRSFNNSTNSPSLFQNKKSTTTNKSTATTKRGFTSGGLMRGLMIGGFAGLLFGSLFANMGILGSILGLFVNIFAIIILISFIRRIFTFFKNKNRGNNTWRS